MEFHFNFNKPTISKNVGEFLNSNLKSEKEKDLLNRILSGRKLQYGDANIYFSFIKVYPCLRELINIHTCHGKGK